MPTPQDSLPTPTPAVTGPSSSEDTPAPAPPKKARVKRTNTLTARRFFDPVVLALGELTGFKADTPVPMKDVQDKVLETFQFTEDDRREVEATNKNKVDSSEFLDAFARRRIQFAFRNRRKGSAFSNSRNTDGNPTVYLKNGTALTTQLGVGQWGLTEAGVAKARELADLEADGPVPVPVIEDPDVEAVTETPKAAPETPVVEATAADEAPETPVSEPAPEAEKTEDLPEVPVVSRRRRSLGSYSSS